MNALVPDQGSFWYLCEKYYILGDLIPKVTSSGKPEGNDKEFLKINHDLTERKSCNRNLNAFNKK